MGRGERGESGDADGDGCGRSMAAMPTRPRLVDADRGARPSRGRAGRSGAGGARRRFSLSGDSSSSESFTGFDSPRQVALKHEPAILHVQCRDVEAARSLLLLALTSGFRESGIVLSGSQKVRTRLLEYSPTYRRPRRRFKSLRSCSRYVRPAPPSICPSSRVGSACSLGEGSA